MDKIIGNIHKTYDYSKFKKLEFNRAVVAVRKERLIRSIEEGEILNPIVVNSKFEIIDGQGRYEAKKELKLPIYYIIDEKASIDDCRRMNTYNAPWTIADFMLSFAESGNENYQRILKACKKTKWPVARVLRAAHKGGARDKKALVAMGNLKFTDDDLDHVMKIFEMTTEIEEALNYQSRRNEAFYTAVVVATETEGYNHYKFLRNCKKYQFRYQQMARLEDELKEFSIIHNLGTTKKVYFEDYMRNKGANVRDYDIISDQDDISTI